MVAFIKRLTPFGKTLLSIIAGLLIWNIVISVYLVKENKETTVLLIEKDPPEPSSPHRPETVLAAIENSSVIPQYKNCPFCNGSFPCDSNGIFINHDFVNIPINEVKYFQTCEENWANFLLRSSHGRIITKMN